MASFRAPLSRAPLARSGSRLRRAPLGYLLRAGVAANNRGDYPLLAAALSPQVELRLYPDAPDMRPLDMEPAYHGRKDYAMACVVWKAGFGDFAGSCAKSLLAAAASAVGWHAATYEGSGILVAA